MLFTTPPDAGDAIGGSPVHPSSAACIVTLIADRLDTETIEIVTGRLGELGFSIEGSRELGQGNPRCIALRVRSGTPVAWPQLRRELLTQADALRIDIAAQADTPARSKPGLVAFDMDSTLIQCEVIDEFARELGRYDEVAAITEEAMRGKLEFDESLRRRVARLRGLTREQIDRVYSRIRLTEGAEDLISELKLRGVRTALLSGGFEIIAERLRERLGLDHAFANRLEIIDDVCTGRVLDPIVNALRKAELLQKIADDAGIPLDRTVAVGDGANDLPMLARAGLGVAFDAKPAVRERADAALGRKNLRDLLFLFGIPAGEGK